MQTNRKKSEVFISNLNHPASTVLHRLRIFTSLAKEVMFLVALVCLFVCGQHYSKSYERIGLVGLCCLMTPGLRTFSVMYDHTFYKQVQISRSDIRPHTKWAVSLVILHMVTSIFLRGLCGYIWVNIFTLSPQRGMNGLG